MDGIVTKSASYIKAEFSKRLKRQIALTVLLIPVFVVLIFGDSPGDMLWGVDKSIVFAATGVLAFSGLVLSLFNWRCPACGKYLGKAMYPRHCSKCGAQLHD